MLMRRKARNMPRFTTAPAKTPPSIRPRSRGGTAMSGTSDARPAATLNAVTRTTTRAPMAARQVTRGSGSTPASWANRVAGPSVAKHTPATATRPPPPRPAPAPDRRGASRARREEQDLGRAHREGRQDHVARGDDRRVLRGPRPPHDDAGRLGARRRPRLPALARQGAGRRGETPRGQQPARRG